MAGIRYNINRYKDVEIRTGTYPRNPEQFRVELSTRLREWKERGYKAVWLRLPRRDCYLIPYAYDVGFCNHHAVEDYFMLTMWLGDKENKLPQFGTHVVRVEAFISRELTPGKREILLVQEKVGMGDRWKLVTGAVEAGEFVVDAALREVREEVGIKARFMQVLGFANRTKRKFGRSELIVCCALEPIVVETSGKLVLQEDEISKARWFSIEEAAEYWERAGAKLELCWLQSSGGIDCTRIVDFCGAPKRMHCFTTKEQERTEQKQDDQQDPS